MVGKDNLGDVRGSKNAISWLGWWLNRLLLYSILIKSINDSCSLFADVVYFMIKKILINKKKTAKKPKFEEDVHRRRDTPVRADEACAPLPTLMPFSLSVCTWGPPCWPDCPSRQNICSLTSALLPFVLRSRVHLQETPRMTWGLSLKALTVERMGKTQGSVSGPGQQDGGNLPQVSLGEPGRA